MSAYHLFAHDRCDRCGAIAVGRTASFFTDETICLACLAQESRLMERLRSSGMNIAILAGCGYLPAQGTSLPEPAVARGPAGDDAPQEGGKPRARITESELRAALRRLRARSALLRVPPGALGADRNLPPPG